MWQPGQPFDCIDPDAVAGSPGMISGGILPSERTKPATKSTSFGWSCQAPGISGGMPSEISFLSAASSGALPVWRG